MIEMENYAVTMENSVVLSGKDEYSFILSSINSSCKYTTLKLIQTQHIYEDKGSIFQWIVKGGIIFLWEQVNKYYGFIHRAELQNR